MYTHNRPNKYHPNATWRHITGSRCRKATTCSTFPVWFVFPIRITGTNSHHGEAMPSPSSYREMSSMFTRLLQRSSVAFARSRFVRVLTPSSVSGDYVLALIFSSGDALRIDYLDRPVLAVAMLEEIGGNVVRKF